VALDAAGRVAVDKSYRTSAPSVLAVGDLIAGPARPQGLREGVAAVERLAGLPGEMNYDAIPSAVYTAPRSERRLTEEQVPRAAWSRGGERSFAGNGRARCLAKRGPGEDRRHPRTDRLLGVHILGPAPPS